MRSNSPTLRRSMLQHYRYFEARWIIVSLLHTARSRLKRIGKVLFIPVTDAMKERKGENEKRRKGVDRSVVVLSTVSAVKRYYIAVAHAHLKHLLRAFPFQLAVRQRVADLKGLKSTVAIYIARWMVITGTSLLSLKWKGYFTRADSAVTSSVLPENKMSRKKILAVSFKTKS